MKTRRPLLLALILATSVSGLRAGNFSDHVPADSLLYFEMTNVPRSRRDIAASAAGKAWEQIDWKQLVVDMYRMALDNDTIEIEGVPEDPTTMRAELEKAERRWDELSAHFSGSAAFSAGSFTRVVETFARHAEIRETLVAQPDMEDETLDTTTPSLSRIEELDTEESRVIASEFRILVDVRDGDALLDTLAGWIRESMQEQAEGTRPMELKTLDWEGLRVFTIEHQIEDEADEDAPPMPVSIWWTVREGVWAIAFTEQGLRDALQELAIPSASSLSSNSSYQDSVTHLGEMDGFFFFNPALLDGLIRKGMASQPAPEANALPPEQLMDWLALDALLPYVFGTRLEAEGIRTKGRMGFSRETPLSRILVDPTEKPAPTPNWVSTEFQQVSSFNWSISRAWTQLEKELHTLSPQAAAGLGMGRMFLTLQLGIDIKVQFLDHFDSGMLMVQQVDPEVLTEMLDLAEQEDPVAMMNFTKQHPTNGQHFLLGLEMKNPAAISSALNTLLAKVHPTGIPEPEDFRGQPIHFPMPANPRMEGTKHMVSYTLLGDYLLVAIGDPGMLRQAVIADQDPESRLWDNPEFLNLRDRLPARPSMLEFTGGKQQEAAMKILQRSMTMMMSAEGDSTLPDFTPLGKIIENALGTVVRKGLMFEVEGFVRFGSPE